MSYFLDTNVIIDAIRNKNPFIRAHFEKTFSSDIFISSIVVAELEFGATHSKNYEQNKILFEHFIKEFTIVPFVRDYCAIYGKIRQDLTKIGQNIGLNDLLIASTAIANGGILVTHNVGEFSRIPNIIIEDWAV